VSLWRQLTRGLRALAHRTAADQDAADEVQDYLERATAAHLARGLSRDEACRAARLELGSLTAVEQQIREYRWEHVVDTAFADLRYAARRLRMERSFTATVVLTLALGIGATTAIFSAVNPILLEPLPYPDAGRIATIFDVGRDAAPLDVTFGTHRELMARSHSFETFAVMKAWLPTLLGAAEPERLEGQRVSAAFFDVLGIRPAIGRGFQPSDDRRGGPNVVILSDGLWRRRFDGDATIVGRDVTLDDARHTVIGVMPRTFENVLAGAAEIWAPLQYDAALPLDGREWGHHLRMIGRLRPGVGAAAARQELDAIARTPVPEFSRPPWAALPGGLIVTPLKSEVTQGVKPALLAVFGAVVLVLGIASVNVANLLLARGAARRGEFAVRVALGAGRARLIRQSITESLLLALLGGALGMVVADAGVGALVALSPQELPRVSAIGIDGTAFAFGLVVTTSIGLAIGLVPALHGVRNGTPADLHRNDRRATRGHRRLRSLLVVTEVALALVLLVASGLLLRSLQRLFAVDAGFDANGVLTMQIQSSTARFSDQRVTYEFFARVLEAVRRVPGVASAALTSQLPLSGDIDLYGVHFDPRPSDDPGEVRGTFRYAVSPGYLETMRIPLRRGRLLNEHDRAGTPRVALISESMARRRLPGLDPIGRRFQIGDGPLVTVVGIVSDVRQLSLALNQPDAVYIPADQWRFADNAMSLVVRTYGDAAALAPAVRAAVWSVDKDQPVVRVATMADLLVASAGARRFALILFEAFALTALVLAAAGIYGVLSGSVAERTREIGIRAALGASRQDILALVVRQGMTVTLVGIAAGLAGALVASQGIASLLFGISALDAITYAGVLALLLAASLLACSVPAWRAARVDPALTLRAE
jgi:putative ABC transport system permease protein